MAFAPLIFFGLCARDQTRAYMATAAATPPFTNCSHKRSRPPSRSCGRLFPALVRSHHRVTYRSSLLAPSQMRRSVSEAGWQLLPPHNVRNSRVVPTPQDGPPKKSFCILLSSLTASAAARRPNITCRGRDSIHLTSGLSTLALRSPDVADHVRLPEEFRRSQAAAFEILSAVGPGQ